MADPLIGRVLEGRYRITGQLARGGMSTVYGAVDERLERLVAVKVMSAALSADPAFNDRFTREARAAAKLTHLNVVSVYDQGTDQGHVFLVMELVAGRTLRDLIRERGRLTAPEAVSIMEPVLAALAAAHRAGLVHRDVKPENILLSDDGVVKVADFGLARAVESDGSTRTGLMMGTVAYCSPEQVSRGRADQRSDVYSSGIVLYELLTGAPPYSGDSAVNIAYQHVHGRVPRPSSKARGIAPQLDALVERATDSDPAGRPLDAGAFLAELADVRNDAGLPVVPVPPRPRGRGRDRDGAADSARTQHVGALTSATDRLQGADFSNTFVHDTGAREEKASPPPPIVIPPPKRPRKERSATARRRRRALITLLVVLAIGLTAGFGSWWLFSGRFARVPAVAGLSPAAATTSLKHSGFKISGILEQQFSENVPKGMVIGTDPGSGSRMARGKTVTLRVSKGQDRIEIPDVHTKSAADAQQLLQTLRIKLMVENASNDTVPVGAVVGTDPAAGTLVKPGDTVALILSSGPPQVQVPGVAGETQADATAALTAAGFKVNVTQDYSTSVAAGKVISQNPAASTQLTKFQTVTIDVSKGPQTVVIPSIAAGSPVAAAQAQLQALGLVVQLSRQTQFGSVLNVVIGLDPKAGTSVIVGSTVTIYYV